MMRFTVPWQCAVQVTLALSSALSLFSCQVMSDSVTPWTVACPSSVHGYFPGKNTGVSCHFLLHGIFPTQGLNLRFLCLLHWQAASLPLSHSLHLDYSFFVSLNIRFLIYYLAMSDLSCIIQDLPVRRMDLSFGKGA